MRRLWSTIFLLYALTLTGTAIAQTTTPAAGDPPAIGPSPPPAGRTSRWLDLQGGNVALDYKRAEPTSSPWYYQLQYRFLVRGLLKLDDKDRYEVGFRVSTGNYFTFSWNNTGAGRGAAEKGLYIKELFLSARPWKHVEIQYGGIGINRGETTEITGYSNNGYLTGERISLKCPEKLFFDEISVTGAYAGDIYKPEIFRRLPRLAEMNYHQFLVAKRIGSQLSVSADYTFQDGIETLREGVKVIIRNNRFADSLVFENYERVDFKPVWGCALSAQKMPTPRLTLLGGYIDIDKDYVSWNADRVGKGRRLYIAATYNFWKDFSAQLYVTRAFNNNFNLSSANRFDLIVMYDFLKALKRADII